MRQHYSLDSLVDYRTEAIPETPRVVNPAYPTLDGQVRKKLGALGRKLAEFGATNLVVRYLCAELNMTETLFPGTDLRLIYESVSSQNR